MQIQTVPLELSAFLKKFPVYFLIPHFEPDGDCIGSTLALASFLRRQGKQCFLHNMGPFERKEIRLYRDMFQGRIDAKCKEHYKDAGAIILDCSTIDRIGDLSQDIQGMPLAVIDHHSSGHLFGDVQFINSSSPSTSILIQQIIENELGTLTAEEANFIFFAFSTDTGFFRHLDNHSSVVFNFVSRLIAAGASPKDTYQSLHSGASLIGRKHLGRLLSRVEQYAEGKLLLVWETLEETMEVGKENRDSDLLYQLLMSVDNVEVVVSLREDRKNFITVGLRSRKYIDVGKIALSIGGGGHARAAGLGLEIDLQEAKSLLLSKLLAVF